MRRLGTTLRIPPPPTRSKMHDGGVKVHNLGRGDSHPAFDNVGKIKFSSKPPVLLSDSGITWRFMGLNSGLMALLTTSSP